MLPTYCTIQCYEYPNSLKKIQQINLKYIVVIKAI